MGLPSSCDRGTTMNQYLMSVYQPDGEPPPKAELDKIMANVRAVRDEAKAAGAWVFSGGLFPPSTATVVKSQNGEILTTDGPYTEGKEHVGGFSIIQASDLDAALVWAKKFARVITLPIEVRPLRQDDSH
jgi:hypothetical protein